MCGNLQAPQESFGEGDRLKRKKKKRKKKKKQKEGKETSHMS